MSVIKAIIFKRETALAVVLFALIAGFGLTVDGFLDPFSIFERSRYWVVAGLIAVPMTFVIATAGIDLSVGSIVALSSIVMGMLYRDAGAPMWIAAVCAVLTGMAAGAMNGGVLGFVGVPPLVVTLATMALFRGLAMGLSKADPISSFPPGFLSISHGDAFQIPLGGQYPVFFPAPLIPMLVAFLIGMVLLRKSWAGRYTEAIGENETAARFAAIDVRWVKMAIYTACGTVCGIAALFHTALFATAKADTAVGLELEVIACVVVGGTRISGGDASVFGSLLGLLIIGILRYGLDKAGVESQNIVIVVGLLLIATVVFNERMALRRGGRT
ncbi:MAG: hypothetical protein AMXMBFR84_03820 [Candidatus Hydrogenedentota bacterium]